MWICFQVAALDLPPTRLEPVLARLAASGWVPAGHAARRALLRCAGLGDWPLGDGALSSPAGDVVFRGDDLFYLIQQPGGLPAERRDREPEIEVGLVSPQAAALGARLAEFAAAVGHALRQAGVTSEVKWQRQPSSSPRLEAWAAAGGASRPRLRLAQIEAVERVGACQGDRLLAQLVSGGGLRPNDLLAEGEPRTPDGEPAATALVLLQRAGLVSPVGSGAVIGASAGARLTWFQLRLAVLLHRCGASSLLWERPEAGSAPASLAGAVLAEHLGQSWCFGYADQPLDAALAENVLERWQRQGWDRLVLLAPEGVSPAARAPWAAGATAATVPPAPLLVESWEEAEAGIRRAFSSAALAYAVQRLGPLIETCTYPLDRFLSGVGCGDQRKPVPVAAAASASGRHERPA